MLVFKIRLKYEIEEAREIHKGKRDSMTQEEEQLKIGKVG